MTKAFTIVREACLQMSLRWWENKNAYNNKKTVPTKNTLPFRWDNILLECRQPLTQSGDVVECHG
jgi:hypothetical protein